MGGSGSKQQDDAETPSFKHYIANAHEEVIMLSVARHDKENRRGTSSTETSLKQQSTKGIGLISKSAFDKTEKEDVNEVSRYDKNYVLVHPREAIQFGTGNGDFISVKLQFSPTMISEDFQLVQDQSVIITPGGGLVQSKYDHKSNDLQDLWLGKINQVNYEDHFKDPKPKSGHYVCNAYHESILVAYKSFGPESLYKNTPAHGDQDIAVWKPGSSGDIGSCVTIPPGTMAEIGSGKGDILSIKSASLPGVIMANITLQLGASVIITPDGGLARSKFVPGVPDTNLWLDDFTGKDYRIQYEKTGKTSHYIGNASKVPVSVSVIPYDETDDITQRGTNGNTVLATNRPIDSVSQYSGGDAFSTATGIAVAGNMVTVAPGEHLKFGSGKGDKLIVQYKKEKSYIAYNFQLDSGDSVIVTPQGGLAQSKLRIGGDFNDLWVNRDDGRNYKEIKV